VNGLSSLFQPSNSTANPTITSAPDAQKSNVGAIAGGVVGGVVALIFLAVLVWFLRRRRIPTSTVHEKDGNPVDPQELWAGNSAAHELQGSNGLAYEMGSHHVSNPLPRDGVT
jgi:hypothetical protein